VIVYDPTPLYGLVMVHRLGRTNHEEQSRRCRYSQGGHNAEWSLGRKRRLCPHVIQDDDT
jgi:hypothetical protein